MSHPRLTLRLVSGEAPEEIEGRIADLLTLGETTALLAYVDGLDAAGRQVVRRRAARLRTWEHYGILWRSTHAIPLLPEERERREVGLDLGLVLLVARLEGPAGAARAIARFSVRARLSFDEVAREFGDRGPVWAASFVTAADTASVNSDGGETVARLCQALVLKYGLPVPTGPLYHSRWLVGGPRYAGNVPLTNVLRVHPLMPDVLYALIASGQSSPYPDLPDAIGTLVDEGVLDRGRVLEVSLQHLTVGHRPGSQKVVLATTARLGLTAEEVPGGLPFVLGVLSSGDRTVARAVLPFAIDLVRTAGDVNDLVRVVAGRPEKGLRQALLKTMSPNALGRRIDHADLADSVAELGSGEQDMALRAACDKALARLGVTRPEEAPQPATALGLWEAEPTLADERDRSRWDVGGLREQCWQAMRSGGDPTYEGFHDALLDALGRDEVGDRQLVALATELAAEGKLSATRAAALLEVVFLGGALRRVWPAAVDIAELCAGPQRPAAGLDKLLRMLVQYAVEVPTTWPLPAHLRRLAGRRTHAGLEARRLAEGLASPLDPIEPEPVHLGLWQEGSAPLPWRLRYPSRRDLTTLVRRLAPRLQTQPGAVYKAVESSLLLDEVLALVSEHGAESVRHELTRATFPHAGVMTQALFLWAHGLLTVEAYWRVATTAVSSFDLRDEWRREIGGVAATSRDYRWSAIDGWAADPPVMPAWWRFHPGERTRFLHTCEALLVHERGGLLLSTPDVADGSLGLESLLDQMQRATRVGPIDLRLALGRLRPVRPQAASRVPLAITDAALTTPDGDRSVAADDVVRDWVGKGGLRLVATRSKQPGWWDRRVSAPSAWRSCVALAGIEDMQQVAVRPDDISWWLPGRPELGHLNPYGGINLADVGGDLDVTTWDHFLVTLGGWEVDRYDTAFQTLVRLQDQGRLDPATAVAAATARWDEGLEIVASPLGWERAMLRGAMPGLWRCAVAIVEAGLARPVRPKGVEALIAVVQRHRHEVPVTVALPRFLESS